MNKFVRSGTLGFGLFALTACASVTSTEELCQAQGSWQLVEFSNGSIVSIPNPEDYLIQFVPTDGVVRVQADCNLCTGSYQADGNGLAIGALACTRAFCGPQSLFDSYVAALSNATSFSRLGRQLDIDYAGGTMRFTLPTPGGG